MTKAEWISVIQKTMMKIDEQRIYAPQLIERHIQSVYEQMYNELYNQDKKSIWKYVRVVTDTTSTEVTPTNGLVLPAQPIILPRASGGLFGFSVDGASALLTDYQGYLNATSSNFDTAGFKGKYIAALMDNKLYYAQPLVIASGTALRYEMIPKFTSLSSTDEVFIPGGAEDHFIDRIIDTIRHMTPVDLFNDNTAQ